MFERIIISLFILALNCSIALSKPQSIEKKITFPHDLKRSRNATFVVKIKNLPKANQVGRYTTELESIHLQWGAHRQPWPITGDWRNEGDRISDYEGENKIVGWADLNFDGYNDLYFRTSQGQGRHADNVNYVVVLFDPKKNRWLSSISIPGRFQYYPKLSLFSLCNDYVHCAVNGFYRIVENKLALQRCSMKNPETLGSAWMDERPMASFYDKTDSLKPRSWYLWKKGCVKNANACITRHPKKISKGRIVYTSLKVGRYFCATVKFNDGAYHQGFLGRSM